MGFDGNFNHLMVIVNEKIMGYIINGATMPHFQTNPYTIWSNGMQNAKKICLVI